ncbi:hypothetical protein ACFLRM_01710 [Acidobacteriota bacterium]
MSLKEILEKIVTEGQSILLSDSHKDWEAGKLLEHLSAAMLKRPAHLQAGLYIAEINHAGYLGRVLYKVKQKA